MKKLLSVILALVLVLGLAVVPAFADETTAPTSSTTVTSHPGISSVTVNSTAAYYQYDNNTGSSVVYIRAKMPNTSTWGSLQSATVVITTTGNAPTVAYNGSPITTPTPSGNAYTYTLDLLNKRYSVSVTDSGNTYTYTIRALDRNGNTCSGYNYTGWRATFVGTPDFSLANASNGVRISWKAVDGAYGYRVFYRNSGGGWTSLGTVYTTSFLDRDVRKGGRYTYTVRCVDRYGRYVSGYLQSGKTITY